MSNYSITWIPDVGGVVDYKVFHKTNSFVIPTPKGSKTPWRYPYADIFIYKIDTRYNILSYRNWYKNHYAGIGFNAKLKWPKGTKLADFGNFKMRVSVENKKYLNGYTSPYRNWPDVGWTHGYDHYRQSGGAQSIAFEIPEALYSPRGPYTLPSYLRQCICTHLE